MNAVQLKHTLETLGLDLSSVVAYYNFIFLLVGETLLSTLLAMKDLALLVKQDLLLLALQDLTFLDAQDFTLLASQDFRLLASQYFTLLASQDFALFKIIIAIPTSE